MWAVADHRCRLGGRLGCLDRLVGPHNGAEGLPARHMCFTALWPDGAWPLALQRRLDHAARRFGRSASVVASAVAGAVAGVVAAVVAVPAAAAVAAKGVSRVRRKNRLRGAARPVERGHLY